MLLLARREGRSLAAVCRVYARLGYETEFHLDAELLERDGFGPTPAFAGFVAEIRNAVVGRILFHDGCGTARGVFVLDLMVTQTMRGKGIGSALMREVSSVALGRRAKQLVWTVDRRNTEALRFYGVWAVDW